MPFASKAKKGKKGLAEPETIEFVKEEYVPKNPQPPFRTKTLPRPKKLDVPNRLAR